MLEIILNRLRGTGEIVKYISGNHLYTLYLGLLFGFVTNNLIIGILVAGLYTLGESFGWGKWVGALCYPNTKVDLEKEYSDKEGYKFPFIHYIANTIVKERKDFFNYCRVALGLRGAIWGALIYLPIVALGYINIPLYLLAMLMYGVGFPLACWLSTKKSFNYSSKYLSIVGEWESQEIYYGVIHSIVNIILIGYIL